MNNKEILPWQNDIFKKFTRIRHQLPHAILLRGKKGIGKEVFANYLIKSLLCENVSSDSNPCNNCSSCHWFNLGQHPDFRHLMPEQESGVEEDPKNKSKSSKKNQISVNQIRELSDFIELSSHRSEGLKVILISPADSLNVASANALLKMLEEPPGKMVFILISDQPNKLLPTILSRCQQITMPMPAESESLRWLEELNVKNYKALLNYSGGSPLIALSIAESGLSDFNSIVQMLRMGNKLDIFDASALSISLGMESAVSVLQKWTYDLMSCKLAGSVRYHPDFEGDLKKLTFNMNLPLLLQYQRKLIDAKRASSHPLNNELQLENLFLQYVQIF